MRIGIYNPWWNYRGGGEKRSLGLAEDLSRDFDVVVLSEKSWDWSVLATYFLIDKSRLTFSTQPGESFVASIHRWNPLLAKALSHLIKQIWIRSLSLDLFITFSGKFPSPMRPSIYMCMFPHATLEGPQSVPDLVRKEVLKFRCNPAETYDCITANSQYTARWVKHRWNAKARIVYSACELVEPAPESSKERIILNVGRFDPEKRQDALIETFQKMADIHEQGWSLHFVGATRLDSPDDPYLATLREAARGLPIFFHVNVSRSALVSLYDRASIYWHAMGFGLDPDAYPEQQEHFGMSTVEATSAGIPCVVIRSGGQTETIIEGVNGCLWSTLDELMEKTRGLTANPALRTLLREGALSMRDRFTKAKYLKAVREIVDELVGGPKRL